MLSLQLQTLPDSPGVYQFFDSSDTIIYVGKAKNLKKRVSSYFNKEHESAKTRVLVSKIVRIEHIVVATENDALLLENNLIKKYQPRYNILLKDGKSYPWICISNERFPRVFFTRKVEKDGSTYFGPYTNIKVVRTLLDLIKDLYPLRNCRLDLSQENIDKGKYKVCLEYHIKNCKGPCEGLQTEEEYNHNIQQIKEILKGNLKEVIAYFKKEMSEHAAALRFEEAQEIKLKLESLENYQAKSTIVSAKIHNVDVFSFERDDDCIYVNYLHISQGMVNKAQTIEYKAQVEESDDQLTVPKAGEKFQLLQLSERNAQAYRQEKFKQVKITDPERHTNRLLTQMQRDLHLSEPPAHIECFDNSNIQGTNPVAACVVFKNAKPSKKDYRHFNIKTVEGPNDFASMEEVVYRRYRRLLDEEEPLPQLIIIDGGKGQLGAALKSLELLGLRGKIAIVGIAKRLEEIFYPGDSIPLYLDKKSETLKVIQHLRNEAHRFGITFHRQKRSASAIHSELEQISGVGKQTQETLLKQFKSAKRLKEASKEEIIAAIGQSRAQKVWDYFHSTIGANDNLPPESNSSQ